MSSADRSLYLYPWDALDQPTEAFVQGLQQQGITSLTLALSYHAGKFLRPKATAPRVYFPEDGVVYFKPNLSQYGKIQPKAASDERLLIVAESLAKHLPIRAWTVLFHNTRLGSEHLAQVTRNAWGDPYPYSLCPHHTEVFDYAVNLCTDLATHQPISELVLESPNWLPYAHGYHHEFAQVRTNAWLDTLLGLCFCDACQQNAHNLGIEGQELAQWVRKRVDSYLAAGIDLAPDQAQVWLQADLISQPLLSLWTRLRQQQITRLIQTISAEVPQDKAVWVIPTIQRPTAASWTEGTDLKALAESATGLEVPFYEPTLERFAADVWHTVTTVDNPSKIRAILRPGPPDLADGSQLAAAHQVLVNYGIQGRAYYNYGLLRVNHLTHLFTHLQS